nr:putative protein p7-NS2 [Pegivirus platyrrhini]
ALPLVMLVLAGVSRERHSVLGLEVCFNLEGTGWDWSDYWWCVAGVVSWALVTMGLLTHGGKEVKLRWYRTWCVFYQKVRLRLLDTPIGNRPRRPLCKLWLVAAWFWPDIAAEVCVFLILIFGFLDVVDFCLEVSLVSSPNLVRLAQMFDSLVMAGERLGATHLAERLRRRGVFLFEHAGHVTRPAAERLREWGFALEPVAVKPEDCAIVRDAARVLGCGQRVNGVPVVARRGDEVLIGCLSSRFDLPPGFVPT